MSSTSAPPRALSVDDYVRGIRAGDRGVLARAITLVESERPEHEALAQEVLVALLASSDDQPTLRVGVSGTPGVGKSTFIERVGKMLTKGGHRVAVLAVDPTSTLTRGSILGDKTRMRELSTDPNAFIRPSPAGGTLGGVAKKTRETMLLCEAAGFDVVLVETVGVGQSEAAVAEMVDFLLLLMLPASGDELQGIKRGVLEVADLLVINKADGDQTDAARLAAAEYRAALRILRTDDAQWHPPVLLASALRGTGLQEIWDQVLEHRKITGASGSLQERRQRQLLSWTMSLVEQGLRVRFETHPEVLATKPEIERAVLEGRLTPALAAKALLAAFAGDA